MAPFDFFEINQGVNIAPAITAETSQGQWPPAIVDAYHALNCDKNKTPQTNLLSLAQEWCTETTEIKMCNSG